jgi:exopolysaccharide production protein ExoZ
MPQQPSKRIVSIQVCRGLAAMLVVMAHLRGEEIKYCSTNFLRVFQFGGMGVDLFFVISGIVISSVTVGRFDSAANAGTFIYHRFARIFPVYWIYTTVVLVAYLFNPAWINAGSGHRANILASYLLVPTHRDMLVLQGWSLSYELYFYVVFFLLLFVSERVARSFLIGWAAVIILLNVTGAISFQPVLWVLTSPAVLEFLAGCLIFRIYRSSRLHPAVGVCLVAAAFLWIAAVVLYNAHAHLWDVDVIEGRGWIRIPLYGTFAALLLLGAMELERSGIVRYFRVFEAIGDWSYSIYLCHIIVIGVVSRVLVAFVPGVGHSIGFIVLIGLPLVLICGYFSYTWIERPLIGLLYKPRAGEHVVSSAVR